MKELFVSLHRQVIPEVFKTIKQVFRYTCFRKIDLRTVLNELDFCNIKNNRDIKVTFHSLLIGTALCSVNHVMLHIHILLFLRAEYTFLQNICNHHVS